MFKRLILDDYAAVCTTVAFIVVASIFSTAIWRALRMPRAKSDQMAGLPFESSSHRHDKRA
ncbi:MAG: hypothetical protein IT582_11170 [Opitutaceae bacterium]|nr:hypothetical protein [Opitutaceae bacterium]